MLPLYCDDDYPMRQDDAPLDDRGLIVLLDDDTLVLRGHGS